MSFSIRRALAQAFEFAAAHFGAMLAVSVIAMVASWAVMGAFMGSMMGTILSNPAAGEQMMMNAMGAQPFLVYLLNFAISLTGYAAMCALCSDRTAHTIGTALGAGVRAMPSLFAAWILLGIGMFVIGLVMMLAISGIIYAGQSVLMNVAAVIAVFAVFAYLFAKVSLILPVAAIDEVRNPFLLIGRSWTLTSGASLKIFVLYVLVMIVLALTMGATFLAMIGMPQPGQMPSFGSIGGMVAVMIVLGFAIQIFMVALSAAIHRQVAGTSSEAVVGTFA